MLALKSLLSIFLRALEGVLQCKGDRPGGGHGEGLRKRGLTAEDQAQSPDQKRGMHFKQNIIESCR